MLHLYASPKWVKQRPNIHHVTHHNGVNSAYPCTGQHSVDQLWDHGKVDRHPVSLFYTLKKEMSRLEVLDDTNHNWAAYGLLLNSNQHWQCSFRIQHVGYGPDAVLYFHHWARSNIS